MGAHALGEALISAVQDRVRAFFGVPIPESHRQKFEPYLAACGATAPQFRWVAAANLHITVRFLGHVDRALAEGIADVLAGDRMPAFELELGSLGYFKRGRLARVVWTGIASGADAASALAAQVEKRCQEAGLEPESRAFSAHLTLARARAREGAPVPTLPEPPDQPGWRATELILYRSQMGRGGSVYEPLRRISLS